MRDRIQILSDRPSARALNDPGRPARRRGEGDLARGERSGASDASGLPGALVRLRSVSGRTSSSCGISFSAGEASSGAESSPPDSDGQPTPTDTNAGTGATSTKTSHANRQARHDRVALFDLRYECTLMSTDTPQRSIIEVGPALCSPITILVPRQWSHGIQKECAAGAHQHGTIR